MDDMLTMWPLLRAIMPFTTSFVSATTLRKLVSIICLASCKTQQNTAAVSLPSAQLPAFKLYVWSVIKQSPEPALPIPRTAVSVCQIVRPLKGLWLNDPFEGFGMAELLSGFATTRKGGKPQCASYQHQPVHCWHNMPILGTSMTQRTLGMQHVSTHLNVVSTNCSNPQGQASIIDEDANIPELLRQLLGQLRHSPQVTQVKTDRVNGHLQKRGEVCRGNAHLAAAEFTLHAVRQCNAAQACALGVILMRCTPMQVPQQPREHMRGGKAVVAPAG